MSGCIPENSKSPSQLRGLVWKEVVEGQESYPVSAGFGSEYVYINMVGSTHKLFM